MDCVLVAGGAGYIGSHACKALSKAGYIPVCYDNLSTGWEEAVKFGPFERGDLLDRARIDEVLAKHKPIAHPDMILREDQLAEMLSILAISAGCDASPAPDFETPAPGFFTLEDVYDDEVESAVKNAYQRDYLMFGFDSWS